MARIDSHLHEQYQGDRQRDSETLQSNDFICGAFHGSVGSMFAHHCPACRLGYVNQCSVLQGFLKSWWYLETTRGVWVFEGVQECNHDEPSYVCIAPIDGE